MSLRAAACAMLCAILCAILCALGGCNRTGSSQVRFKTLKPGLEYALGHTRGTQSKALVTVHIVRFDPNRWSQRVVMPVDRGGQLSDAAAFREVHGGAAAINAGYFDPQNRPLGLLVSDGKQRSRLRKVEHGVLTIAGSGGLQRADLRPDLQHAKRFAAPKKLVFAIECGPRLVVEGKTLTFKPGIARRTAIGYDSAGAVYWIITSGVISLADFAAFLARPTAAGGLGLHGALNLDGGSSTMFDLAVGQTRAVVRSSVQVPVGLVLVPRPPQH